VLAILLLVDPPREVGKLPRRTGDDVLPRALYLLARSVISSLSCTSLVSQATVILNAILELVARHPHFSPPKRLSLAAFMMPHFLIDLQAS